MATAGSTKKEGSGSMEATTEADSGQVAWPRLQKKWKLNAETIVRGQIMTIRGVFSAEECEQMVRTLEGPGAAIGFETTSRTPAPGHAFRLNDRISRYDPAFARAVWAHTGLDTLVQRWIHAPDGPHPPLPACWGLSPHIRIYRYHVGHRFDKHFDDSVRIPTDRPDLRACLSPPHHSSCPADIANQPPIPAMLATEYTLLIYLTGSEGSERADGGGRNGAHPSELRGGETVFYPDPIPRSKPGRPTPSSTARKRPSHLAKHAAHSPRGLDSHSIVASVKPLAGLALIHRHGANCLLHEGREVTAGVKYVLRSDIMFG